MSGSRTPRRDLNLALRRAIQRALADSKLTGFDHRVLIGVIELTAGWSKVDDELFLGQLADTVYRLEPKSSTRVQRDKIGKALRRLEKAGSIWREPPPRGRPESSVSPRYRVGLSLETRPQPGALMQPREDAFPPDNAARDGCNAGQEMQPRAAVTMQPRAADRPLGTPHTVEQVSPAAHARGIHAADHDRDLNQNGDTEGLAFSRSSTIEPEPGPFDDKPAPIPAEAQARIDKALAGIRKAS